MNLFEELHRIASKINTDKHDAEYISIVNEARKSAGLGSMYITRSTISQTVEAKLHSDGLRTEYVGNDHSESYYKILWDKPHKKGIGLSA